MMAREGATDPWQVRVSSPRHVYVADSGQIFDLTEVRGFVECPDKETADEIARRLKGEPGEAADRDPG